MTTRNERAVKFADSELIGLPVRITSDAVQKDGIFMKLKACPEEESTEVQITDLTSYLQIMTTRKS